MIYRDLLLLILYECSIFISMKYEVDVEGEVEGMLVRFSFVFLKTKAE